MNYEFQNPLQVGMFYSCLQERTWKQTKSKKMNIPSYLYLPHYLLASIMKAKKLMKKMWDNKKS